MMDLGGWKTFVFKIQVTEKLGAFLSPLNKYETKHSSEEWVM